jgi:hypothetical protein
MNGISRPPDRAVTAFFFDLTVSAYATVSENRKTRHETNVAIAMPAENRQLCNDLIQIAEI